MFIDLQKFAHHRQVEFIRPQFADYQRQWHEITRCEQCRRPTTLTNVRIEKSQLNEMKKMGKQRKENANALKLQKQQQQNQENEIECGEWERD